MATSTQRVVLESDAQAVADASASPPFIFQLGPEEGRHALDQAQSGSVEKPMVDQVDVAVPGGPNGEIPVRIVRPAGYEGPLPIILYVHGAGWVFGDKITHDRLVRELAVLVGAAVVFPDYRRAPEARYPSQIEECWTVARWIVEHGSAHDLDSTRIAVAGDSVGGNMTAALTLLAKERGGVDFRAQVLFYPVTDAAFDTPSYHEFAEGYALRRDGMQWFWDQYTSTDEQRSEITASPLRATLEELSGLPKALVITGEADVLRDEGEAYAAKLRAARVDVTAVRYGGIIHDFMMLDGLRETNAARAALAQSTSFLRSALGTAPGS
ncbi:MAG: alpha/beta hydrolase [Gaiellaceae bacterium]